LRPVVVAVIWPFSRPLSEFPAIGHRVPLAAIRNEWIVVVVEIPELQLLAPGGEEGIVGHFEEVAMLLAAVRIEQVVILEQILDLVAPAAIRHEGLVPVHQDLEIGGVVLATSGRYEGVVLLA